MGEKHLKKILSLILCICLLSSYIQLSHAKTIDITTIYVDDDNIDGPWDGSFEHPYNTISQGIDAVNENQQIVFVFSGKYTPNEINITKNIRLQGEHKNSTVIDGTYANKIINIFSHNVVVDGFTIKNAGGFKENAAIFIRSNNVTISNCTIFRTRNGIFFDTSKNVIINNCSFFINGNSIKGINSSKIQIINSEICHSGIGINIMQSKDIIFKHLYLHENGIAALLTKSSQILMQHCASCDNNDNGRGVSFYYSNDITVDNCNAIHSGVGFKIVHSFNINFIRCSLAYNTHYTFWIHDDSKNISINQCEIIHNFRHGIHITDSQLTIHSSNLYDNKIDAIIPRKSEVYAEDNYWGSSLGPFFSKGFRLADRISKDFGSLSFIPWANNAYQSIGTDWKVEDDFDKTIISGYYDEPLVLEGIDTDMDGAPDWWEESFGYNSSSWENHAILDPDNDALTNIQECYAYEWGANPFQKDLFLEFDHTVSATDNAFNILPDEYVLEMKQRFAEHDIMLHVDQGSLGGGEEIPYVTDFDFSTLVDLYWDYFLHNDLNNPRKHIFHYGLICDQGPGNGFAFIGWAHLNSFCISADELAQKQPRIDRGWLITCGSMHETGHTLGLLPDDFGGNDNHAAIKPKYSDFWIYRNYKSIMNYRYTYSILDYSDGTNGKTDYNDWHGMEFDFFKNTHFEWPKE